MKSSKFTSTPLFPRQALVALLLPLIAEQALSVTIGLADTLMVSSVGEAAVSGVSLVDSFNTLMIQIMSALATGGAVVTSQYIGHQEPKNAKAAAAQILFVLSSFSVLVAAVVIGGMLGANVATMATYSLICNMVVALVAPMLLSFVGSDHATFLAILSRVGPVLVLPFVCAQLCRKFLPGAAFWVSKHSQISFYMWLVSLVFVIGRTTAFIIDLENAEPWTEIALGLVAMVICVVQFGVGRMLGRRYGDAAAGGQSLGQKNTVLAVWMAQSFLNPISSIAPTAYIVWQNFVNSYQIYKKDRETTKDRI